MLAATVKENKDQQKKAEKNIHKKWKIKIKNIKNSVVVLLGDSMV